MNVASEASVMLNTKSSVTSYGYVNTGDIFPAIYPDSADTEIPLRTGFASIKSDTQTVPVLLNAFTEVFIVYPTLRLTVWRSVSGRVIV